MVDVCEAGQTTSLEEKKNAPKEHTVNTYFLFIHFWVRVSARKNKAVPDTSRRFHRTQVEHTYTCIWDFTIAFSLPSAGYLWI